jgi:hypothetical protein
MNTTEFDDQCIIFSIGFSDYRRNQVTEVLASLDGADEETLKGLTNDELAARLGQNFDDDDPIRIGAVLAALDSDEDDDDDTTS